MHLIERKRERCDKEGGKKVAILISTPSTRRYQTQIYRIKHWWCIPFVLPLEQLLGLKKQTGATD